ncbi:uncharacterized protein LOC8052984 isoform X2 [Ixodes scapularis]|uniref:uncharacterized protein LOC8052984 isoform X2 n=1 Tax=Ixodes scapularis TaxID=6945 RepID=UPI001C38C897|nr:uncharacterized protein LOC8052984 isoform X2 [Ixodes scapularis]
MFRVFYFSREFANSLSRSVLTEVACVSRVVTGMVVVCGGLWPTLTFCGAVISRVNLRPFRRCSRESERLSFCSCRRLSGWRTCSEAITLWLRARATPSTWCSRDLSAVSHLCVALGERAPLFLRACRGRTQGVVIGVRFGEDCLSTGPGKHGPASDCHQEGGAGCGVNGKLCDGGFKRRRLGDTWEGLPPPPTAMFQPCPKLNTAGLLSPSDPQRSSRAGRSFLTIRHNASVYHTEEWKPRGCTMYLPLSQDVMINTRNVDQLSFENDQFFLADGKGNYIGAKSGNAIHFWRYDTSTKRLFISQSILFLREQDHREALEQLEWL